MLSMAFQLHCTALKSINSQLGPGAVRNGWFVANAQHTGPRGTLGWLSAEDITKYIYIYIYSLIFLFLLGLLMCYS